VLYAFDDADEALTFMPMAVRRALDRAGRKLSLASWQSMTLEKKQRLVDLGSADVVDVAGVTEMLPDTPSITPIADPIDVPDGLAVSREAWQKLRPLDRYALVKCASKPEKLARAVAEILRSKP
jgi:hypothetical protein